MDVSCIFCTLFLWGKGNGCSAFSYQRAHLIMPLLLLWGRADIVALLFWLDSTSSMLSTSFLRPVEEGGSNFALFLGEGARNCAHSQIFLHFTAKITGQGHCWAFDARFSLLVPCTSSQITLAAHTSCSFGFSRHDCARSCCNLSFFFNGLFLSQNIACRDIDIFSTHQSLCF